MALYYFILHENESINRPKSRHECAEMTSTIRRWLICEVVLQQTLRFSHISQPPETNLQCSWKCNLMSGICFSS